MTTRSVTPTQARIGRRILRSSGPRQPCPLTGSVIASTLPEGLPATTVHRGSFADLGAAHAAVVHWCTARGHRLTGTRWEVYGPHDHPAQQWTEISWILAQAER